ncbi:MAG: amidohydrolase, partial [Gammaproteobacteria bacterium]
ELAQQMTAADQAGLRLAIHAIGDRAIDDVIAILQSLGGAQTATRRYRIEHFQHPTFDAIQAAADSGIIAAVQPFHAIDDGRWAEERIGHERARSTYAFRSILDAGGRLSFGSDWPVAPLSPLEGIYAAVTRRTTDGAHPSGWQPQEKIGVEEALSAYTLGNAFAAFEEQDTGTLSAGKRADFIVLSADPRHVPAEQLRGVEVMQTIIDGKVVFTR